MPVWALAARRGLYPAYSPTSKRRGLTKALHLPIVGIEGGLVQRARCSARAGGVLRTYGYGRIAPLVGQVANTSP